MALKLTVEIMPCLDGHYCLIQSFCLAHFVKDDEKPYKFAFLVAAACNKDPFILQILISEEICALLPLILSNKRSFKYLWNPLCPAACYIIANKIRLSWLQHGGYTCNQLKWGLPHQAQYSYNAVGMVELQRLDAVQILIEWVITDNCQHWWILPTYEWPDKWMISSKWSEGASCLITVWSAPDYYSSTRSLGALRAPTSSWRPFGPLDFVLRALRPVRRARLRSGPVKIGHFLKGPFL